MNPSFHFLPSLTAETNQLLLAGLLHQLFPDTAVAEWLADLRYQQQRQPVQAWLVEHAGRVVGCKLGYERQPGHYYSWLGGVLPEFRGQGLAAELLGRQHAWAREQGYHRIRTHTYNRWRAMLLLNLRHGFDIIGTVQGRHGLTIVLEKELAGAE